MVTRRLDLTFRARGPHFLSGTFIPSLLAAMRHPSSEPRLLAVLRELCDIIDLSPLVAGQLISGGIVDVVCSAAWLFGDGAHEKTLEQSIAEGHRTATPIL